MNARRGLVTAAAILVTAGIVSPQPAGAAQPPAAESAVSWEPCYQELGYPFECATVMVPLDYDEPNGTQIGLALTRLPAGDPANRIGSLLLNPGGPGGSGVDFVLGAGPFLYTDEVRDRFDLVGFDPRGIARSNPLLCFDSLQQAFNSLSPFTFPTTPREEKFQARADIRLATACAESGGDIIDHMSTANVARDMDVMREQLGDAQLTFAGYSYGSYVGETYANMFPDKVRAVVIDGVLDPEAWANGQGGDATLPLGTRIRSDMGAQDSLEEFFRLCDAGGDNCAFSGNSEERYAALANRLRPVPQPFVLRSGQELLLTYSDLVGVTLSAMYDSFTWPLLAQLLAYVEEQLPPAAIGAAVSDLQAALGTQEEPPYPNFIEGFPGVACSETDNPSSFHAWQDAADAAEPLHGYFARLWTFATSACSVWPGWDTDRYTGPWDHETANPVLVVGTTFDPATRYQGAVITNDLLADSALLTVHGWAHTSLFLSTCADEAIADYLISGTTPAPGTVCEQDVVPFAGPTTAAAAERVAVRGGMLPPAVGHTGVPVG